MKPAIQLDLACVRKYLVTPAAANELNLEANPGHATVGDAYIQLSLMKKLCSTAVFLPQALSEAKQRALANKALAMFVDQTNLLSWWTLESAILKGAQEPSEYYKATLLESTIGVLYLNNKITLLENLLEKYWLYIVPDLVIEPIPEDVPCDHAEMVQRVFDREGPTKIRTPDPYSHDEWVEITVNNLALPVNRQISGE